jgi:predicted DNA-binding transcriptional regulator AlpA
MTKALNIKTIGVEELSALIFRAVPTIKNDLYRKPNSLPPRIVMPGSKKLVWLEADVVAWLEKCRQVVEPVVPQKLVKGGASKVLANLKIDRRF